MDLLRRHPGVKWLPNNTSSRESDLQVETSNHSIVLVECTAKRPKLQRINDPAVLVQDVKNSLRKKSTQHLSIEHACLVTIFLPESNQWPQNLIDDVYSAVQRYFASRKLNHISECEVVWNDPPHISTSDKGQLVWTSRPYALQIPNPNASYCIPPDF